MNAEPYKSWQCRTCGYIYDEAVGDPDEGLAPGTQMGRRSGRLGLSGMRHGQERF